MEVTEVPLDKIRRYSNNPRKNDKAVAAVAKSLQRYKWRQPIVVDSDYVIVVGDTRYCAAESLGWTKAPVHVAKDLTAEEIAAYRLADNKVGELAEWDQDKLEIELRGLESAGFAMELTGFSDSELEKLLAEIEPAEELPDLADADKLAFQEMMFILHDDQAAVVKSALELAKSKGPFEATINENSNGNALHRICEVYLSHVAS